MNKELNSCDWIIKSCHDWKEVTTYIKREISTKHIRKSTDLIDCIVVGNSKLSVETWDYNQPKKKKKLNNEFVVY